MSILVKVLRMVLARMENQSSTDDDDPAPRIPDHPASAARPEAFLECFYAHDGSCMRRDHAHPLP